MTLYDCILQSLSNITSKNFQYQINIKSTIINYEIIVSCTAQHLYIDVFYFVANIRKRIYM